MGGGRERDGCIVFDRLCRGNAFCFSEKGLHQWVEEEW